MRIAGGKFKGRKIISPGGREARPTLQIARKSIFDTLGARVHGASVLDLFSGVGTLGLEALSRGARIATFVDVDQEILSRLRQNLDLLGLAEQALILHGTAAVVARHLARDGTTYDLIFLDPPYESEELATTLEALEDCHLLSDGGILVVEYSKQTRLPDRIGELLLWKNRQFGDTSISFYHKQKEK